MYDNRLILSEQTFKEGKKMFEYLAGVIGVNQSVVDNDQKTS